MLQKAFMSSDPSDDPLGFDRSLCHFLQSVFGVVNFHVYLALKKHSRHQLPATRYCRFPLVTLEPPSA
jgi:hypothetical protein